MGQRSDRPDLVIYGMHTTIRLCAILVAASLSSALSPFGPGPHSITQWEYGTHRNPSPDIQMHARIWAPIDASDETAPVLAFVTAFGATIPSTAYDNIFRQMASHGVVVIGYDHAAPLVPQYVALGAKVNIANQWMAHNLPLDFKSRNLSTVPDVQHKLAVGGHSAGNHIALQALVDSCGLARAFVMIDPVDGVDPYGIVKTYVVPTPPAILNVTIPALHIETGLDPVSAHFGFPACAPPAISNDRFYRAMRAPIWQINATENGHLDVLDSNSSKLYDLICKEPPKTVDKALYRSAVGGWVVAFMSGLFGSNQTEQFKLLQNPETSPVSVLMHQKNMPASPQDVKPSCSNAV